MAKEQNWTLHQGEDKVLRVVVARTNITGWTLAFAVAPAYGETASFTKTTTSGIVLTDPTDGVFEVSITDTDTDSLPANDPEDENDYYVWDVKRSDAGEEVVLAWGKLKLLPKVSA